MCLIFSRAFVQYNRFYPCSNRASHVFVTHTTRGTTLPRRLTGLYFQHFSRTLWTLDLGPYTQHGGPDEEVASWISCRDER